jgi:hypothetical protein
LEQENLAIQEAKKCLTDTDQEYAMPFYWRAIAEANLNQVDASLADFDIAETTLRKAIAHRPDMKEMYSKYLVSILKQHAAVMDQLGRPEDATKLRAEAAAAIELRNAAIHLWTAPIANLQLNYSEFRSDNRQPGQNSIFGDRQVKLGKDHAVPESTSCDELQLPRNENCTLAFRRQLRQITWRKGQEPVQGNLLYQIPHAVSKIPCEEVQKHRWNGDEGLCSCFYKRLTIQYLNMALHPSQNRSNDLLTSAEID